MVLPPDTPSCIADYQRIQTTPYLIEGLAVATGQT
jgi:hypothetical protein